MRKFFYLFFSLLLSQLAAANMGSPVIPGSMVASPFTSKYVNILDESLQIILNKDFKGSRFIIEYHISSDYEGIQVPLLFYAFDLEGDFKVWFDGKEVHLQQLPAQYEDKNGTFFKDFDYFFKDTSITEIFDSISALIESGFYLNISDLKYFETDIARGKHKIRVEYSVNAWIDRSNWMNEYSIRYALSPAKYWKSLGNLKITLDATVCKEGITINLDNPDSGSLNSIATWTFDKLPVDILQIDLKPQVGSIAKALLFIDPFGLALIFFVILIVLHIVYLLSFRRKNLDKRFSWVMIAGSFIVPALAIIIYLFSFPLIDGIIGEHASKRHGYYILSVFIYPFITPIYLIIMWLVDRFYKRYLLNKNIADTRNYN